MDYEDVTRQVRALQNEFRTAHFASNRLLLHLPLAHADAIWSEFRQRLDPDERARIESQDGHPVEDGKLYGMTVCVAGYEAEPWITQLRPVRLQVSA